MIYKDHTNSGQIYGIVKKNYGNRPTNKPIPPFPTW